MIEHYHTYQKALSFAKNHYENFPVASFLIKKDLRKHVSIIYWFARTADDIADEGNAAVDERLNQLNLFEQRFLKSMHGNFVDEFDETLFTTITEKKLSKEHFLNLIKAFRQDVVKSRYKNFEELMHYCSLSANPVGRLILELYNIRDENAFQLSDKICTALQLTNFYQDTMIDYSKGRIYYPLDELTKFNVTEKVFELKDFNLNLQALVKLNVDRAFNLFNEGAALSEYLSGRLKYEIKWTIAGGKEILNKIKKNNYNIFIRPKLSKKDFFILLIKSFVNG
ncbi:MAG: squalene synthase HpnC [Ignavibacteriales bacterium]|nr:squalene synthase HpnC [Ignavibacteriales bacterium]